MSPSEIQDGEEQAVMLELNVPDDTVLLSDFMLWHLPLNNGAICTKHESKEYEKCSPENQKDRMLTTWERIFDLDMRDPYFNYDETQKSFHSRENMAFAQRMAYRHAYF